MNFAFQLSTGIIIAAAIIELFRRGARMLSEDAEFERGKSLQLRMDRDGYSRAAGCMRHLDRSN